MNSVNRGFRGIVHWFLFTSVLLIYFTVAAGFETNRTSLSLKVINFIFVNPITPLITLFLFILILLSFTPIFKNFLKRRLTLAKAKTSMAYAIVITIINLVFCALLSFYFGLGVNVILYEINNIYELGLEHTLLVLFDLNKVDNPLYFLALLFLLTVYPALISFVRMFFLNVYFDRVMVNIHLKNGEIIKDRFIVNPNIDGGLMVGDTYGKSAENKTLIPKANIEMITFNRVGYSFGEKRRKVNIINPNHISEEEHNEIIRKWRSSHKPKHSNF
ncbi:hypothetical protein [Paenibacillus faecalis]|uniref:hypothetical protein n=1 Tax=Paenibacillus faecalis TaxID=2079532 RepID=UPI000D1079FA|nr:hypothetical protein [Paenibacillus faecalis]